jgi:hypothetical protein
MDFPFGSKKGASSSEICRLLVSFTQQSISKWISHGSTISFAILALRMSGSLFAGQSSEVPLAKQVWRARSVAMDENSDREELEKKLEQSEEWLRAKLIL